MESWSDSECAASDAGHDLAGSLDRKPSRHLLGRTRGWTVLSGGTGDGSVLPFAETMIG